jgi:small subunit ribosomal protein S3
MGQKVNPVGFRLIINKKISSVWYENFKKYASFVQDEELIRNFLFKTLKNKNIVKIKIKRNQIQNLISINIYSLKPKRYFESLLFLKKLYSEIYLIFNKQKNIKINFFKVFFPYVKINLIINFIEQQIKNRIAFARITRQILNELPKDLIKGIKIQLSGRLEGIEKAKTEWYQEGQIPLQSLMFNIEYLQKSVFTKFGVVGIKLWILKKLIK